MVYSNGPLVHLVYSLTLASILADARNVRWTVDLIGALADWSVVYSLSLA